MVTMITLHMLCAENREQALGVLTKNTELSRKAKGFVSRNIYFCLDDPLKGYSITTWESREDLENFRVNPARPPLKGAGVSPVRPPLEGHGKGGAVHLETPDGPVLVFTSTDSSLFECLHVP